MSKAFLIGLMGAWLAGVTEAEESTPEKIQKALQTFSYFVDANPNFLQYQERLVNMRAEVEQLLDTSPPFPDTYRASVGRILFMYENARRVWQWRIDSPRKCTGGICLYSADDQLFLSLVREYAGMFSTVIQPAQGGIFLPEGRWNTTQAIELLWRWAKEGTKGLSSPPTQTAAPSDPVSTQAQETPALAAKGSLEKRPRDLKELRQKNLITPEEYYEKRSELLKGL
ncbi:MAG: SHOCT domain-containing protein [Deltaproteobacteria bacterium]|nr:SHOCT domain-containing protein [Deltaproteobacteria bacterium]